jgi:hypothetical protein
MREAIKERLQNEYRLEDIQPDDVEVYRDSRNIWAYGNVYYEVSVKHLFGRTHVFWISVKKKRRILNL